MDPELCTKKKELSGEFLDLHISLKIANHLLRKRILHRLYELGIDGPITKKDLARDLNENYHRVLYQLNEHLRQFWTVTEERKVRGAREELIVPANPNTIYCNIGSDTVMNIIDPLANIFGRLNIVGTRCDNCSVEQQKQCMSRIVEQGCAVDYLKPGKKRDILAANYRKKPYTPVDHILVCTISHILDGEKCTISPKSITITKLEDDSYVPHFDDGYFF